MIDVRRLFVSLSLAACEVTEPNFGAEFQTADRGACRLADSDPEVDVKYADVLAQVIVPGCSCHLSLGGFGVTVGGLLLTDYDRVLGGGRHGPEAVIPFDPCGSYVVQKTGTSPPFGARMPLNGRALKPAVRQLLIDWIAEGAKA